MPQNELLPALRKRVANAPREPGVYRWKDGEGTVLYVGKAKDLRARLRSYVSPGKGNGLGPWKESMMRIVADFEYTVVNSDLEAYVLETNFIKQLRPKYNILMKDDKNYVYVRVSLQDPYPRVDVVRKIEQDGAKYFGPKTSAWEVNRTLGVLRRIFPFRTCKMDIRPAEDAGQTLPLDVVCKYKDRPTPCLDHHMEQCVAPCIGSRTPEQYRSECIDGVLRFFRGDQAFIVGLLREKMMKAAAEKQFEVAATLRDHLQIMEGLQEKQIISDATGEDCDVVGVALLTGKAQVVLLQRRSGRIVGEVASALSGQPESIADVLSQFLPQYYGESEDVPAVVYVGEEFSDRAVLEQWLSEKRGRKVVIRIPERGTKSHLLQMAEKNAQRKVEQQEAKWEAEARNTEDALTQLQELLHLPNRPMRIEGYDISHLGGTETVGSMVVCTNGKPHREHYRSFTIRSLRAGDIDDYQSLQEVLTRRMRHLGECLRAEEKKWKLAGLEFGRGRKSDLPFIREALASAYPDEQTDAPIDLAGYVAVRRGEEVVGFGELREATGAPTTVSHLWVHESLRSSGLHRAILRLLLRRLKKGKAYMIVHPSMEQFVGEIGFRYVLEGPPAVEAEAARIRASREGMEDAIVVMYEAKDHKADRSLETTPDLLMIDGGKGQLSAVLDVLTACDVQIPVIGLAKREEEVFLPGQEMAVPFPPDAPGKFLLMRLRDEAHRFANRHREGRIGKHSIVSVLDEIPGIGPLTKKQLLDAFGSVSGVRDATDEQLRAIVNADQLLALRKGLR